MVTAYNTKTSSLARIPLYQVRYVAYGICNVIKWETTSEKHQLPAIDSIEIPLRLRDCVALEESSLLAPLANTLLQLPKLAKVTIKFEDRDAAIYGLQTLGSELLQLRSSVKLICQCPDEKENLGLSIIVSWC